MTQSITDLFVLRHKLMKKLFPERRKELPVSTQISLFKPSNMTKPDIDGMGRHKPPPKGNKYLRTIIQSTTVFPFDPKCVFLSSYLQNKLIASLKKDKPL